MLTWLCDKCIVEPLFLIAPTIRNHVNCIYCSSDTKVTNSRLQKRLNHVWRRRKCLSCGAIFSTTESFNTSQALSVQKKHRLEPFSRDTLLMSVYDSLRHRKTALEDAAALTTTIVSLLTSMATDAVLERDVIVTVTITVLERFDRAAATSYQAFHPKR